MYFIQYFPIFSRYLVLGRSRGPLAGKDDFPEDFPDDISLQEVDEDEEFQVSNQNYRWTHTKVHRMTVATFRQKKNNFINFFFINVHVIHVTGTRISLT